jgi:hypothetical protein
VPRRIRALLLSLALAALSFPADAQGDDRRVGDPSTDEVGPSLGETLAGAVSLRHVRDPLPRGVDPSGRQGRADLQLSLPLGGPLWVAGGVRMRYEQVREVNQFDLLPTAGFEIRF